jgi:predicted RNA-binding Zn-ribbon protein involved in translation (DUF1610 family)
MALISCPECGKHVSNRAPACVSCGNPINPKPTRVVTSEDSFLTRNRGFGDVVFLAPLVIFAVILAGLLLFAVLAY